MHANFPQKKEALLLDDGQDHASKEEAPISTPAFIYESVAASFSSRSRAEGSHHHDNVLPQDAEAALLDDGGKHLPSIAEPSFIYESVAASLAQKAHGSTLLHESAPQENAFLLDDGIGKPIMKKEVAKPSYIYESVIAASSPLRPPSDGSILRNNVPREENAFLLDDDTVDPIMQKKEDPIIAKPSFIYESVAASLQLEVRDAIHNNVPQEEHGFLLADGGKPFIYKNVAARVAGDSRLHDNVSQQENSSLLDDDGKHLHNGLKKEELIKAKLSLGNEPVAALPHPGSPEGSLLGDNVPQPDNVLLLDNGGKHVHESPATAVASTQDGGKLLQDNVPQEKYAFLRDDGHKKPISSTHHDGNNKVLLIDTKPKKVKSQSLHDTDVKKSLYVQENKLPAKAPPSLLHDNVPQGKHAFLVDDGGIKHVEHDSPVASSKEVDVQFTKEEEHVLHDNASQGEYSSLLDDGGRKELHSNKLLKDKDDNIKNHKKLPIYHKLLRMVVGDSSRNMQIKNGNEESVRMVEEDSSNKMIHEGHPMTDAGIGDPQRGNLRMVVSDSSNNMTHKGAVVSNKEGSRPNEENLRMAVGDSTSNMIEKGSRVRESKGNSNEENLRIVVGDSSSKMVDKGDGVEGNPPRSEVEGYPAKEESLRMVVGDSSNNMIQTDYKVQGNPSNEENLRMVVGDSSKSMVQEGYGSPPKLEDSLRMVVDDTPNNMIKKRRGRLRLCTSLPIVCHQLAHAEQMNHIALYGRLPTPTKPACCGILCVDLNTDQLNCGSCGNACGLLKTCCNGICTDLNTDNLNCGQCNNPCAPHDPCQYGMCGYY